MGTLGLILKITDQGEQEHSFINKESKWAKHASEARSYIKNLEGFDGTSKTTTFVKFIGNIGYLICLVQANPKNSGRPFDNTAAWIYIPFEVEISGEKTKQILDDVEAIISDPTEIKKEKLEEIFNKSNPVKNLQASSLSQLSFEDEGEIVVRYYGEGTGYELNDLLGNDIAQIGYNGCKALFLIDKTSGITPVANKTKVITTPIRKICTIDPPLKNDKGFTPYINFAKGDKLFSKPIEISEGATFNIIWKKTGYQDVVKPYTVSFDDNNKPSSGVDLFENDYNLIIKRSIFKIIDDKNRQVDECLISIEGKPLNQKETPFPELWFEKEVEVKVEKQGYKSYSKKINIKGQNSHIIKLDNIMYNYEFKIPAYNDEGEDERLDEEAKIVITTKENLKDSPIKGYKLNKQIFLYADKVYRGDLKYDENKDKKLKRKSFMEGFIVSFITCLIIVSGIIFWREKNNYESKFGWPLIVKVQQHQEPIDTEEQNLEKNVTLAIKYLDENNEWKKDSLDKYYNGLYDDMINLKFVKIKDEWHKKLLKSIKFQEIVTVATTNQKIEWDTSNNKNKDDFIVNDSTINIEKYIEWIKDNKKEKDNNNEHAKK